MRIRRFLAVPGVLLAVGCGGAAMAMSPARNSQGNRSQPQAVMVAARPLSRPSVGQTISVSGALTPGDPRDGGRFVHAYEIDLDGSEHLRVRIPATGLDPMIRVDGPEGFHIENDDAMPPRLDALVDFSPPTPGRYRITVTTAPHGQTGPYELFVGSRAEAGIGPRIALGQRIQGLLTDVAVDPDFGPGGAFMSFEASGGSVVRLRITSRDFDTIATVFGPGGQTWVNDDANDLGPNGSERALDSTLVVAIPITGVYRLMVTAYGAQGRGAFEIATTLRPPVIVRAGEVAPAMPFAGPDGRGRVYGLYAGITAYTQLGQLYGCADDARLLGDAMRAAHLQRPDEQTVLTDAMASRQAFLDGLAQIAQRAQPDDVVMVFWSGHGNVQPAVNDPIELDGLDETIQLFDGPLTDTEVVRALDPIRAGTIVLALDSCHSGGFADDFVRRPGRVGLFSSDEDVLSDTAEPRRAGGYLSWYLRTGVVGRADYKPHDGVLYAGELTDYLTEGFIADHRLMNREGGHDPAQRLVARRGSVGWNVPLWVYPRGEDLAVPVTPSISLESALP